MHGLPISPVLCWACLFDTSLFAIPEHLMLAYYLWEGGKKEI